MRFSLVKAFLLCISVSSLSLSFAHATSSPPSSKTASPKVGLKNKAAPTKKTSTTPLAPLSSPNQSGKENPPSASAKQSNQAILEASNKPVAISKAEQKPNADLSQEINADPIPSSTAEVVEPASLSALLPLGENGLSPAVSSSYPLPQPDKSLPFDRRELLNIVRKGVVIIRAKVQVVMSPDMSSWSGTGFIVDLEQGLIATNQHITGNAVCTYEIRFANGMRAAATLLYFDPFHDFAFLKVDPAKLPKDSLALELSNEPLKVNDTIYAMGNAAGDEFSTSKGIVFSIYENIGNFSEQSFRFAGLTAPGASGSPVISEEGKVVGIIYGGKFVSGVALPVSYIADALQFLKKKTLPPRYSLGFTLRYLDLGKAIEANLIPGEAAEQYHNHFLEAQYKILNVSVIAAGSDASQQLEAGDILWKMNGQLVGPDLAKFEASINEQGSKEVELEVYRHGKLLTLKLSPYPLPLEPYQQFIKFAGAVWFSQTEQSRLTLGDDRQGIYMCPADANSPFKEIYENIPLLSSQMVKIISINQQPLNTLEDLKEIIRSLKEKETLQDNTLVVRYENVLGEIGFGSILISNRSQKQVALKYQPRFDKPTRYTFNFSKEDWDIEILN